MKFAPKIPAKSTDFSANLSRKILRNLTFFSWPIRSPALMTAMVYQILSTTVEPPITATSPQRPVFLADSPYIDSCFNLSTMASLFCPQDGHGREVQLYFLWYCTVYGDQSWEWKNIIRGTNCSCPLRVSWWQCSEGLEMHSLCFVCFTLSVSVMLILGRCWLRIDSKPSNTSCLYVSLGKGEELKFSTVQKDDEFLGVAVQLPCFPYFQR